MTKKERRNGVKIPDEGRDEGTKVKKVKVKINNIIFKDDLYPREKVDENLIQVYAENIGLCPPITINQDNILIDGKTRLEAAKKKGRTEINCYVEQTKSDEDIFRRAVELNATHGKQLSNKEKKDVAIKLFDGKNGKELVIILSVSTDCFNKWVRDVRREREEALENRIIKEYLKAELTQEQVAEKIGVSVRKVSEVKTKFSEKINLLIRKKDEAPAEILERFREIIHFEPYPTNIWEVYKRNSFDESDTEEDADRFNKSLLHYYTEPFDTVYVYKSHKIIDACKELFRRHFTGEEIIATPNLALLDDKNLEYNVKMLKIKMKKGYIVLKASSLEQDTIFYKKMGELDCALENRIIIPRIYKKDGTTMKHGYDTVMIFRVK